MKKNSMLFLAVIFTSLSSLAQEWHAATDTLKVPKNIGNAVSAIAYINYYDTVPCSYKIKGSEMIYPGYKLIYKQNGFFIDTRKTLNVFFDDKKKKKIKNVYIYRFN